MLKNYLLISARLFRKNKIYSFLNVLGLTLGVTCALIIFLFVHDELTFDHNHSGNIYRLNAAYHLPNSGGFEEYAASGPVVGEMLRKDFLEVEEVVRFRKIDNAVVEKPGTVERGYEKMVAADSSVFKVFNFPFIAGDPATALLEPMSLVVSRRMAEKYFMRTDVIGETLRLPEDTIVFKITGVMENLPTNTHLKFDFIFSFETLKRMHYHLDSWWNYSFHTYLKLSPSTDATIFENKVKFISRKYIADQEDGSGYKQEYSIIPLSKIHLNSNLRTELEPNSKASYVYIFGLIGVFILIIACINFMNLATAKAAARAKEIGLRKVVGAFRKQLIGQFLTESFLMTIIAMVLSVVITTFSLPFINDFLGKELAVGSSKVFWMGMLIITLAVGVLAGIYPAIMLSGFKPVNVLKGNFRTSSQGNFLRRSLVVFQFSISIFLISGTLIVFKHLDFLRHLNLGFDKESILYIPTGFGITAEEDFKLLKEEIKKSAKAINVTLSSSIPGKEMGNNVVRMGWDESAPWSDMRFLAVDHDFVELYNLEIIAGRDFDQSFLSDENEAFLVNESGMRRLGWKDSKEAIGQKLKWQDRRGYVIGVVKDFHFMAANIAIEPFIMVMNKPWSVGYLSVKLVRGNLEESILNIKKSFSETMEGKIFEYSFLDQEFDQQYKSEERFMSIFTFFAGIAIVIACFGLYGLAMFMAEIKVKEIGVRKVLGASSGSLVILMTSDFIKLVLIAFALATPLAFWSMSLWLSSFPYREKVNPILFLVAGVLSVLIALITVAYQSIQASMVNPVDSIRNS